MSIDDCFQLGYIIRVHGINGEVQAFLDVDKPEEYKNLESVFISFNQDKNLIPFFIEEIQIAKNKAIIKFEDVEIAEEAQRLISASLYLPLNQLPSLGNNKFYFHELINLKVHDIKLGELGTIKDVYSLPQQDIIAMDYKGKEVLFPITDEIVKSIDREGAVLSVELPEGLIEAYLE